MVRSRAATSGLEAKDWAGGRLLSTLRQQGAFGQCHTLSATIGPLVALVSAAIWRTSQLFAAPRVSAGILQAHHDSIIEYASHNRGSCTRCFRQRHPSCM